MKRSLLAVLLIVFFGVSVIGCACGPKKVEEPPPPAPVVVKPAPTPPPPAPAPAPKKERN